MSSQVQGVKVAGTVKFLEGFVVFFSGVEEARRTKAKEVVVRFGGKCADKFSNAVTCGVIERVGASGFKELITSKVHIVSMRWLLDCASSRALAPMESVQYKVPPFLGLVIVCTQVDIDERDRVQELVKKNGGTFCERFVGGQCTHLIAKTPTGDKFLAAKKCGNVNIVTNGWVEECAKQKVWVSEMTFSVELLARRALKQQQENDPARIARSKPAPSQVGSVAKTLHIVEEIELFLTRQRVADLPSFLTVPAESSNVFDGMVFWVRGYTQDLTDYATSCILAGGGLRSMVLYDGVTTAVLGAQATQSDLSIARRHPCGVDFVNLVWITEQLFSFHVLCALIEPKEPFEGLFKKAESVKFLIRSVDEFCAFSASESARDLVDHSLETSNSSTLTGSKRKFV